MKIFAQIIIFVLVVQILLSLIVSVEAIKNRDFLLPPVYILYYTIGSIGLLLILGLAGWLIDRKKWQGWAFLGLSVVSLTALGYWELTFQQPPFVFWWQHFPDWILSLI